MVPVVDHRDRSHQPTGHRQERLRGEAGATILSGILASLRPRRKDVYRLASARVAKTMGPTPSGRRFARAKSLIEPLKKSVGGVHKIRLARRRPILGAQIGAK